MITLAETKNYLRVDHTEDDKLILSLIDTAKRLVQDVGRIDEAALAVNELVQNALKYAFATPLCAKTDIWLCCILFLTSMRTAMALTTTS